MQDKKVYQTTLRLQDINHLFDDPNISPFSDYYQPYSFKTGMDYVVDELYSHPSADGIELTVLLPADQITPDLEAKTLKAVGKYSEAWAQNARQGQNTARYKGLRTLRVGILAFVVLNGLALWFGSFSNFGIKLLSEGLLIGGWVLLWWPLDALAFGVWENRLEESAYKALQNLQLTISSE
jgi:hypothetical protein